MTCVVRLFLLVILFSYEGANAEPDPDAEANIVIKQFIIKTIHKGADLHEPCESTKGCKTPNAECHNYKCTCKDDYVELDGKCVKGKELHETCTKSKECVTLHAECVDNKCMCMKGYKEADGKCIESKDLHEECTNTYECGTAHAECIDNKCTCGQNYTEIDGKCIEYKKLHENCTTTSECVTPNAECIDSMCKCGEGYKEVDGDCIAKVPLNGSCDACVEDPECADSNAECYEDRCICKQGYTDVNGKCVAETPLQGEIQGSCVPITGDCTANNSECNGGTCECRKLYVNVGRSCYSEKNYNESCTYTQQCPESMFCNCDVCICKEGLVIVSADTCLEAVATGDFCNYTGACSGLNTACINNTCVCVTSDYGRSKTDANNCVAKTTTSLFGPLDIDSSLLAYKPEYSVFNSTEYINEAKPVIDFLINQYTTALTNSGLDVILAEPFALENGTGGGSALTIIFTYYNPDYDKPTHRFRRGFVDGPAYDVSSKLNEQIIRRSRSVLQAVNPISVRNIPDVRAASRYAELCDVTPDCDLNGGYCADGACICAGEYDADDRSCI